MKRETLYASLAGCASFFLIAYGSYRYFSPSGRTGIPTTESAPVPAGPVVEIPPPGKAPASLPEKRAGTDNAAPVAARPLPATPTAYGAASAAGPSPVETNAIARDDEEGGNRYSNRKKPTRLMPGAKAAPKRMRGRRNSDEED